MKRSGFAETKIQQVYDWEGFRSNRKKDGRRKHWNSQNAMQRLQASRSCHKGLQHIRGVTTAALYDGIKMIASKGVPEVIFPHDVVAGACVAVATGGDSENMHALAKRVLARLVFQAKRGRKRDAREATLCFFVESVQLHGNSAALALGVQV
jgi:hypothetical protein